MRWKMVISLIEANEIMGKFNRTFDEIRKKKEEFEKKRLYDKEAGLIYEGLRFAYIELCKLQENLEESLIFK
jgi:hypothetical protein